MATEEQPKARGLTLFGVLPCSADRHDLFCNGAAKRAVPPGLIGAAQLLASSVAKSSVFNKTGETGLIRAMQEVLK